MAKKTRKVEEQRRIVLVGTYRGDQLKDWPGLYCWPLDGDVSAAKNAKDAKANSRGGAEARRDNLTQSPQRAQSGLSVKDNLCASASLREKTTSRTLRTSREAKTDWLSRVTELWLYKGTADERRYRAKFVGVKTREELFRDYGYPCVATTSSSSKAGNFSATKNAKSAKREGRAPARPHGTHYALFKTELLYRHKNDLPGEADAVIVRLKDFARSPKVRKQLREYLESPDRRDPDLAKLLPSIVTSVPPERLKVCEAAVQMDFAWIFKQQETCEHIAVAAMISTKAKDENKLTCVEICAGAGGQAIGLDMAGFEHVALVLKAS